MVRRKKTDENPPSGKREPSLPKKGGANPNLNRLSTFHNYDEADVKTLRFDAYPCVTLEWAWEKINEFQDANSKVTCVVDGTEFNIENHVVSTKANPKSQISHTDAKILIQGMAIAIWEYKFHKEKKLDARKAMLLVSAADFLDKAKDNSYCEEGEEAKAAAEAARLKAAEEAAQVKAKADAEEAARKAKADAEEAAREAAEEAAQKAISTINNIIEEIEIYLRSKHKNDNIDELLNYKEYEQYKKTKYEYTKFISDDNYDNVINISLVKIITEKELMMGSVRVYVNERNEEPVSPFEMTNGTNGTNGIQDSSSMVGGNGTVKFIDQYDEYNKDDKIPFGNFFYAFNYENTNQKIYTKIKDLDKVVQSGSTVTIFGYGYSGSGKTYTLFGKPSDEIEGITHKLLFDEDDSNEPLTVEEVFELYVDSVNFDTLECGGQRINTLDNTNPKPKLLNITKVEYNTMHTTIEEERKKNGRIKRTLNNAESSRSHLFIKIKKGQGYYMFCDMGGRENPIDIYNQSMIATEDSLPDIKKGDIVICNNPDPEKKIPSCKHDRFPVSSSWSVPENNEIIKFSAITSEKLQGQITLRGQNVDILTNSIKTLNQLSKDKLTLGSMVVKKFKKKSPNESTVLVSPTTFADDDQLFIKNTYDIKNDEIKKTVIEILQTVIEGFYINETINHLVRYFETLNGKTVSRIVKPSYGNLNTFKYEPTMCFSKTSNMVDILTLLKTKDDRNMFCMFACVRQNPNPKYMEFNKLTLEFAQSISSAGAIETPKKGNKKVGGAVIKFIDKSANVKKAARKKIKKAAQKNMKTPRRRISQP